MKRSKGAKQGVVVTDGHISGDSLKQLCHLEGIIVDHPSQTYVADRDNHRIMCWYEADAKGSVVVGRYGEGREPNPSHYSTDLSFDVSEALYVVDHYSSRIQNLKLIFNRNRFLSWKKDHLNL